MIGLPLAQRLQPGPRPLEMGQPFGRINRRARRRELDRQVIHVAADDERRIEVVAVVVEDDGLAAVPCQPTRLERRPQSADGSVEGEVGLDVALGIVVRRPHAREVGLQRDEVVVRPTQRGQLRQVGGAEHPDVEPAQQALLFETEDDLRPDRMFRQFGGPGGGEAMRAAVAPSVSPAELPAVTRPPARSGTASIPAS